VSDPDIIWLASSGVDRRSLFDKASGYRIHLDEAKILPGKEQPVCCHGRTCADTGGGGPGRAASNPPTTFQAPTGTGGC
jgi:hypothetical protein